MATSYEVSVTYGTTATVNEIVRLSGDDVLFDQETAGGGNEYDQFEDLAKKLLAVTKAEVDAQRGVA